MSCMTLDQGGITCEAIHEPRKSLKAINKRVIINFRNKNVVITRFCNKNEVFVLFIDIYIYIYIHEYISYIQLVLIHHFICLTAVSYGRDDNQQEHKSE